MTSTTLPLAGVFNRETGKLIGLNSLGSAETYVSPDLVPNRITAVIQYPTATNFGRTIAIGSTIPYELRVSNGKEWVVTVPSLTATVRAIATNGAFPNNISTVAKQMQSRRRHVIHSKILKIRARLVNKYIDTATWTELSPGAASTYTMTLEKDGAIIGTFQLGGNPSMVVGDGAYADTDDITLTTPLYPGDVVYTRTFMTNTAGIVYEGNTVTAGVRPGYQDLTNGEFCQFAASGLTDQTAATGVFTGAANQVAAFGGPFSLMSLSTDPAILIVGDSIEVGIAEAFTNIASARGIYARALNNYFAYSKTCQGGDSALKYVASHTMRVAMKDIFTHVVCNYGVNDINNLAQTPAQVAANLTTIAGYFSGKPFYVRTITAYSTSTDNFTKLDNQYQAATVASLNAFNGIVRAGISGVTAYFEVSDIASTGRDSNLWPCDGVTPRLSTQDGLHPTAVPSESVRTSGVISYKTFAAY
jgi:hypothetical protein